ncbi:MAG: hypothetical protein E7162_07055 [Firmicutes bacterium]|nr:hypothetical protein [Bacillota bacterium]
MSNYEKSGKIFIAYKGDEYTESEISRKLSEYCSGCYTVKSMSRPEHGVVMAKVVYDNYVNDRDPYFNSQTKIGTVSGYDQDEIATILNDYYYRYNIDDSDKYHVLMNKLYKDIDLDMFKKLGSLGMHFCSVIWDERSNKFVGGVTDQTLSYTNLYYGYTSGGDIMFSNDENVLKNFCNEVNKMDPNTYMFDGEIYKLNGEKVTTGNEPLIKRNRENADYLLQSFNSLFGFVAKEAVKKQIETNLDEYLASDDPKKKLSDYIVKELDGATQREVLELIKKTIDEYNLEENVSQSLRSLFDKILEDYTKTINVPVSYNVYLNGNQIGKTSGGFYHEKYEQILRQTELDEPIMLIGPAGSGKNVAVSQVAESLGLHMYYTNNASNEFKLTGFIDAGGNYRDTEFYKAFKNGGLFFLDEIDNSDPSALIVINSALANGYMAFPHETIDRHPDFRIIAAANTWGKGADLQYVGRNALDAATLDRFDNIFFDYDRKLEECLYPSEEVLRFMWSFRDAVLKTKIPHVVSTRGIGKVYKKDQRGIPVNDILTSNVVKNLSQDDVNTVIGNMSDINASNKFYSGIKQLVLRR